MKVVSILFFSLFMHAQAANETTATTTAQTNETTTTDTTKKTETTNQKTDTTTANNTDASTKKDETSTGTTTYSTYYWERCQSGKGSGPKGYQRVCDGENHGECIGTKLGPTQAAHDHECAEECTDTNGCGGFEFDNHDEDGESCMLFSVVTGLNRTTESHLNTHHCYIKEATKELVCKSEDVFSGRYKRLCDGKSHGECQGTQLGPYLEVDSADLCAAKCDGNSTCGGFEYDVHDESRHCYLYGKVSGAELPDFDDVWTHECYAKAKFVEKTPSTSSSSSSSAATSNPARTTTTTTTMSTTYYSSKASSSSTASPSTKPTTAAAPNPVKTNTTRYLRTTLKVSSSSTSSLTKPIKADTTSPPIVSAASKENFVTLIMFTVSILIC